LLDIKHLWIGLICLLICKPCLADGFNASLSMGYEKITSPLVRIDLDSPLILVEGRSKLAGDYYQFGAGGVKEWDLSNGNAFDFSTNIYIKQSPNASDLNFSSVSLDATFRKKLGDWNFGIGPSVQHMWIANSSFRDSVSLQSDLTYIKSNGDFTNAYIAIAKKDHVEDFSFLNSKTISASITHHINNVAFGFSALDLQFNVSHDKNTQDADDLSNYAYYGRASIDRKMFGLTWSAGASITKSYFESPFFDGFAKRRDLYVSYEFGVEREISDKLTLSLEVTKAKNNSNLALFESNYDATSLSLNYTY
jgi:hypothetical protein